MTTALFGQDSYSTGHLTLTGGIRFERLEGYLPAQTTPANGSYFPAGTVFNSVTLNGVTGPYTVQSQFQPVRHDPLWHNWAPRFNASWDIRGNGKSALKFSVGKYLDQINTGTPPNPNGSISQTYAWNDTNNNLVFDPGNAVWNGTQYVGGELGALQSTTIPNPAPFNPAEVRPSRNEETVEFDQELKPGLAMTVSFVKMDEHNQLGTVDQNMALWGSLYSQLTLTDPGRDGVLGTSDDQKITVYQLNAASTVISTSTINSDLLDQHYKGMEFDLNKRYSNGWGMIGGYTYGNTTQAVVSLSNPNNAYVNASGWSGGRKHNFKWTGSYQLPWQVLLGANFRLSSGLPITRTWAIPACTKTVTTNCTTTATTVNAEARGSVLLPWLPGLDLRAGRFFKLGGNRFDVSLDLYNVTNANTTFSVRTNTATVKVFPNNDPTQTPSTIAAFMSPTGVLAPRIIRMNLTWTFGSR